MQGAPELYYSVLMMERINEHDRAAQVRHGRELKRRARRDHPVRRAAGRWLVRAGERLAPEPNEPAVRLQGGR